MTNRSPRSLKARTSRTVMDMGSRLLRSSARLWCSRVYPRRRVSMLDGPGCRWPEVGSDPDGGGARRPAGRLLAWRLLSCSPEGAVESRGGGMRKYEIMLILPAEAEEPVVAGAVDRIAKILGQRGGEVTNVNQWGRRRFAHEIEK